METHALRPLQQMGLEPGETGAQGEAWEGPGHTGHAPTVGGPSPSQAWDFVVLEPSLKSPQQVLVKLVPSGSHSAGAGGSAGAAPQGADMWGVSLGGPWEGDASSSAPPLGSLKQRQERQGETVAPVGTGVGHTPGVLGGLSGAITGAPALPSGSVGVGVPQGDGSLASEVPPLRNSFSDLVGGSLADASPSAAVFDELDSASPPDDVLEGLDSAFDDAVMIPNDVLAPSTVPLPSAGEAQSLAGSVPSGSQVVHQTHGMQLAATPALETPSAAHAAAATWGRSSVPILFDLDEDTDMGEAGGRGGTTDGETGTGTEAVTAGSRAPVPSQAWCAENMQLDGPASELPCSPPKIWHPEDLVVQDAVTPKIWCPEDLTAVLFSDLSPEKL